LEGAYATQMLGQPYNTGLITLAWLVDHVFQLVVKYSWMSEYEKLSRGNEGKIVFTGLDSKGLRVQTV
jgi:hypothetical protein